jgi:chemotaxis signal transduction protein
VIFKPGVGASFGIIVDQVGDIVSVSSEDTETTSHQEQVPADFTDRAAFVSRICRLDDQLLIVLDPRRFLNCIEQTLHP